jgi:hypothetical protein
LLYHYISHSYSESPPLHGSIYAYNSQSLDFLFYANFSFHIDDNDTDLYYFESGPVAVTNSSQSTVYIPVQCGTSFQRLFLLAYDMKTNIYRQSSWILHNGVMHMLHYDPYRQRLIGLRDHSTFTLIIEEYNLTTLHVNREYTRQDGAVYAFPYAACSIFDYEENWIVQVRTRFENPSITAYYLKMDLNLVGHQDDIVTEFRLLPDIHNLCTMTYDINKKIALVTWQHGSINEDIVMMYMDPYTSEFQNQTLLFDVDREHIIESIQAIYNQLTGQVLFMLNKQMEMNDSDESWMIQVDFLTMKIIDKKSVDKVTALELWNFFLLQ